MVVVGKGDGGVRRRVKGEIGCGGEGDMGCGGEGERVGGGWVR